jgi:hypothetical protein
MSETDSPGDELDRDTTGGGDLANWLNTHGSEWVVEVKRVGGEVEYVGVVDGRFTNLVDGETNEVALGYLADAADAARRLDAVRFADSPFADLTEEDADA